MSICNHRPSATQKRTLNGLCIISMIIVLLSVTSALEASTAVSAPFTASGRVDFTTAIEMSENPDDVLLVGLAAAGGSDPDLFALRLTQVRRGWLPSWTLRTTSVIGDQDDELSTVNLRTQETDPHS